MRTHRYTLNLDWTGNRGSGTSGYRDYDRSHSLTSDGKPPLDGSSDPAFRGDAARWNPEELLVASISSCHMLWYLHLASEAGIIVTGYADAPDGVMEESADGGGQFAHVTLRPRVALADEGRRADADALHARAHALCFIARSVNFPVQCEPVTPTA